MIFSVIVFQAGSFFRWACSQHISYFWIAYAKPKINPKIYKYIGFIVPQISQIVEFREQYECLDSEIDFPGGFKSMYRLSLWGLVTISDL